MAMKVVPEGSNMIVTDDCDYNRKGYVGQHTLVDVGRDRGDWGGERGVKAAVFEAAQGVERSVGFHGLTNVEATKDAQADIERSVGFHGQSGVATTKDAEANISAFTGNHFAQTNDMIREVGADLERSGGLHYADTVKTLKDVEAQLERSGGSRYGSLLETIKDSECRLLESDCETREEVQEVEIALERVSGKLRELIKDTQLESAKNTERIKDQVQDARKELLFHQLDAAKDTLLQFKEADIRAFKIAAAAEKTACDNQRELLLQFKDAQLQAERIAAQHARELAECCCEMKELVKEEAHTTRALINQQEVDRLRERASKAEQQLALLNLQIGLPLAARS